MTVVAQDNKKYDTLCLPIQYLNGWLLADILLSIAKILEIYHQ